MTKSSVPKGAYANYFEVGYTAFELVIDFGQTYSQRDAVCHTRIVTSPVYARALLHTLSTALEQYRRSFGNEDEETAGPTMKRREDR